MHITNLFKHWTYQIFSPTKVLREKHEAFKSLLTHDSQVHVLIAELEEIYYNQVRMSDWPCGAALWARTLAHHLQASTGQFLM